MSEAPLELAAEILDALIEEASSSAAPPSTSGSAPGDPEVVGAWAEEPYGPRYPRTSRHSHNGGAHVGSIVTYKLSNGAAVAAEIAPGAELIDAARMPEIDFEEVRRVIEGIGADMGETIRKLAPTTGSVEFGIELGGEAGVPFVAKGTATAHVTVTLEWEAKP